MSSEQDCVRSERSVLQCLLEILAYPSGCQAVRLHIWDIQVPPLDIFLCPHNFESVVKFNRQNT